MIEYKLQSLTILFSAQGREISKLNLKENRKQIVKETCWKLIAVSSILDVLFVFYPYWTYVYFLSK